MAPDTKPIYGYMQYPHMGFELRKNPDMDIAQMISQNLSAWMSSHPSLDTFKKVAARSGVGFGTVQRAKNGEGNITVQNLESIAQAFGKHANDLISLPDAQQADQFAYQTLTQLGQTLEEGGRGPSLEDIQQLSNIINADLYRSPLSDDEKTIVEAFRLFGEEMKEHWLIAARERLSRREAITPAKARKQRQ